MKDLSVGIIGWERGFTHEVRALPDGIGQGARVAPDFSCRWPSQRVLDGRWAFGEAAERRR